MKTPNWKDLDLGKHNGFDIAVIFHPEEMNAKRHFMDECGWSQEEYDTIKGNYWFRIEVTASKAGEELGTAHLGGMCDKSLAAFKGDDLESMASGYMPQLIEEANEEAAQNLQQAIESAKHRLEGLTA